jgi:hypothetical protein
MNVKTGHLRPLSAVESVSETRNLALDLMRRALELLDKDPSIAPLAAPQLQLAIDRLICPRAGGSRHS